MAVGRAVVDAERRGARVDRGQDVPARRRRGRAPAPSVSSTQRVSCLRRLDRVGVEDAVGEREARAQPAHGDAHLVDPLGVGGARGSPGRCARPGARTRRRRVGDGGGGGGLSACTISPARDGLVGRSVGERVAACRLAARLDRERAGRREARREVDRAQGGSPSRNSISISAMRAHVARADGRGCVRPSRSRTSRACRPSKASGIDVRRKSVRTPARARPCAAPSRTGAPRRRREPHRVDRAARDRPLVLGSRVSVTPLPAAAPLHRHQPAAPVAAQPQRDAGAPQALVGACRE